MKKMAVESPKPPGPLASKKSVQMQPLCGELMYECTVCKNTDRNQMERDAQSGNMKCGFCDSVAKECVEQVGQWVCQGCGTRDPEKLRRSTTDSAMKCEDCGVEESGVAQVPQERAGAGPERDDKTWVCTVNKVSAEKAAIDAMANGPESSTNRKNRLLQSSGGTRLSRAQLEKGGMQQAQNAIDSATIKSAREHFEHMARAELVNRNILLTLERLFRMIGINNDNGEDLCKYIRLETIRIYAASLEHKQCCKQKACSLVLTNSAAALVAYSCAVYALEMLVKPDIHMLPDDAQVPVLHQVAAGFTKKMVEKLLVDVKQHEERYSSPVQRMAVSSTVMMIAGWSTRLGEARRPCGEPAPPKLLVPPSIASVQEEYGKTTRGDPGDVPKEVLKKVETCGIVSQTMPDVRNAALVYMAVPAVLDFLADHAAWYTELIACMILSATGAKLGHQDSDALHRLRHNYLKRCAVSATTFEASLRELTSIVKKVQPPSFADQAPGTWMNKTKPSEGDQIRGFQ
tara:strand:- start:12993 stop:14540 length:1548 start_codon:yes stop_codon:yes gene_type:complete